MIGIPPGVRILVAMQPVDFRRGADSLAALAKEALQQDPFSGTVLVFRAKRADRVKVVAWDGSGLVMLWKRLDEGAFKWPPVREGVMRLTSAQLATLLEGLDWSRGSTPSGDTARPPSADLRQVESGLPDTYSAMAAFALLTAWSRHRKPCLTTSWHSARSSSSSERSGCGSTPKRHASRPRQPGSSTRSRG
jgi:transposase